MQKVSTFFVRHLKESKVMKQIQKNLAQTKEVVMQQHIQTGLSSWEGEEARKLEQAERDGRYNSSTHLQVDRQAKQHVNTIAISTLDMSSQIYRKMYLIQVYVKLYTERWLGGGN